MSKAALQYINKGVISQSDFDFLKIEIDPSQTKKYLLFIVKAFVAGINPNLIRNRVSEYHTLLERNQVEHKDINAFKTFSHFDIYVQQLNNKRSIRETKREIKKEAEIILDNDDLFIVCPHSHEASCLYGAGTKWCTTSVNGVHFNSYYQNLITFYYIQVRSKELNPDPRNDLHKLAVVAYPDGRLEVYDAGDYMIGSNRADASKKDIMDNIFKWLGVSEALFKPRNVDERLEEYLNQRKQYTELNMNRFGISILPESIGDMPRLKTLILSENSLTKVPESIGKLHTLKTLYLFQNHLSVLPQSLECLTQLEWLGLKGNPISRKTIRELKRCLPNTRIYTD